MEFFINTLRVVISPPSNLCSSISLSFFSSRSHRAARCVSKYWTVWTNGRVSSLKNWNSDSSIINAIQWDESKNSQALAFCITMTKATTQIKKTCGFLTTSLPAFDKLNTKRVLNSASFNFISNSNSSPLSSRLFILVTTADLVQILSTSDKTWSTTSSTVSDAKSHSGLYCFKQKVTLDNCNSSG